MKDLGRNIANNFFIKLSPVATSLITVYAMLCFLLAGGFNEFKTAHINDILPLTILPLWLGALFVFFSDSYRTIRINRHNQGLTTKRKIHHPKTHAAIALLLMSMIAMALICNTLNESVNPYFIVSAFFIGTISLPIVLYKASAFILLK